MKNMKKLLITLLACACVGATTAGFAACSDDEESSTPQAVQGPQGEKGDKGETGAQGAQGAQGVGVQSVTVDENGNLVITLTDGTKQTVAMPDTSSSDVPAGCSEGLAYMLKADGTYMVRGIGLCSDKDIVIPATYKGKPVTEIGKYAFNVDEEFQTTSGVTSIVIPDTVVKISAGAFESMPNLSSVTLGASVKVIEGDGDSCAFYGCAKLVEVINKSPYITVEKGSEENGRIGKYAFAVFNSGDTYVNKFENDNGYVIYAEGAEKTLLRYEGEAVNLTLPSSITAIGKSAFEESDSLTSVVIPNSVQTIGEEAFSYCKKLTSVTIGTSVTSIEYGAFAGCRALTEVKYNATQCVELGSSVFSSWGYEQDGFVATIGANVKAIPGSLFYESAVREVNFEAGSVCESIGGYAFSDCDQLTSITLPNSVQSMGEGVFWSCNSLTSVTLPNSLQSIGDRTFYECNNLTNITLPNTLKHIGHYAFNYCLSLTLTIPVSVDSIGANAVRDCMAVIFEDTSTWYMVDNFEDWENKTGGWVIAEEDLQYYVETQYYFYKL